MRRLLQTLLLIALFVQLPSGVLAAYADSLPHSHDHSHSHVADVLSHISYASADANHEQFNIATDCAATHHHCTSAHLSLMVNNIPSVLICSEGRIFELLVEAFSLTQLLPSIERPKWAFI
jgi:hypothetical protein